MQRFRFYDIETSTFLDYQADTVEIQRVLLNAEIIEILGGTQTLSYEGAIIRTNFEGVWVRSNGTTVSAEDLWQRAIERSLSGVPLFLFPDLDDLNVYYRVHPVPEKGPSFYETEKNRKRLRRGVQVDSTEAFGPFSPIWDRLSCMTTVLGGGDGFDYDSSDYDTSDFYA